MSAVERCRAESPTQCTAHTRLYRDGELVAEGFPVAAVSDHLAEPGTVVWLDLLVPSPSDMEVLTEELGLHPLAIEDALHDHQRPKLDRYRDHDFLAAYAVLSDPGPDSLIETGELAAFFTDRALITVRKSPRLDLADLLRRWDETTELAGSGVAYLAYGLLDHLVDGHSAAVAALDDEAEQLEDLLFADTGEARGDLQRRAFVLRKDLTRLRRAVLPMREVLTAMTRPGNGLADDRLSPYFRDVEDHVLRAIDAIDGLREVLATILDINVTLASNRLNESVFRLTAYAAILAATTAITGYFGQNIPFPGSGEPEGVVTSTALLVLSVGGLYAFFRRKGWL